MTWTETVAVVRDIAIIALTLVTSLVVLIVFFKVTALVDGRPQRVMVSTKAIRTGLVIKPLKRKYGYTRDQKGLTA